MTLQARAQSRQRPVVRCGLCGREIHPDAASLPLWGKVGGHCKARLATMTQTLHREGLGEFLNGPIEFQPIESEDAHGVSMWVYPSRIQRLQRRATALGFRVIEDWPRTDGPASCELKLPVNDKARRRLVGKLEQLRATA